MDEKNLKERITEDNVDSTEEKPTLILPTQIKAPAKKLPIKKIITFMILFGVISFAASYGYKAYNYSLNHEDTDNATVTGHIYQISPRITGTVSQVFVNDNQRVKKGQVLVKLDTSDYQINVMRAKAALEVTKRQSFASKSSINLAEKNFAASETQANGNIQISQVSIDTAQVSVQEAQDVLAASKAQVGQIDANLVKAQADYKRYSSLAKQGAIPAIQLDSIKATLDSLIAQKLQAQQLINQNITRVSAAKENIGKAKAQLYTSQGGLQQANASKVQAEINKGQYQVAVASISQADVALKDAMNQMSYTTIVAPADGIIGKKNVEVGQRLQVGQPLMAVVGHEAWINANFKETQLEEIKKGQMVEIKLDSFPKYVFKGKVDSIAPGSGAVFALLPPDNATGNFTKIVQRIPVKILFDKDNNKDFMQRVTAGMSATVSIETKEKK
ncbi:MAG: HlyD family secretion protein [Candidatus Sericytochromatia bacterium]|nr:HlyD family secretion protein [Candidatus Sericytochromatia bacterium]